jgi:hypothetical protein
MAEPTRPLVHPVLLIPASWQLLLFTQSSDATRIRVVGSSDSVLLLFPCILDLFLYFFHLPSLELNMPSLIASIYMYILSPHFFAMHMLTCIWYVNLWYDMLTWSRYVNLW